MAVSNDELVLLDFWPSPFCMRVKIAFEEKKITNFKCIDVDPYDAKINPLLHAMNPVHKKIPVLIHNGRPICESMIIVEYIDQVWKDDNSPSLLSLDPFDRARARFWVDYIDRKLIVAGSKLSRAKGEADLAKEEFIQCLKLLELELSDKQYFGGNTFGYLDIALIPDYSWFYAYETCANFSIEVECPKLIAWANRCMERESVKKSLPSHIEVYNFVLERNKRLGIL